MGLPSTTSVAEYPIPETDLTAISVIRGRFNSDKVRHLLRQSLGEEEFERLVKAGVDQRMIFGINSYYLALATGSCIQCRFDVITHPSAAL